MLAGRVHASMKAAKKEVANDPALKDAKAR
jgi:hypothetical protein